MKKVFDKINTHFETPPTATGPNVFKVSEYAESVGLKYAAASVRLRKLVQQGILRKVRIPSQQGPRDGYEYIGKD